MNDWLQREELLIGKENIEKLKNSKVIIFGLGGVGGSAIEAIVRAGINNIALVDCDKISETNINRQIFATTKTIGKLKVEAAKERLIEINPNLNIEVYNLFFNKENSNGFDFSKYDYIIDAIDTVSSKIELIVCAKKSNTKIISSMGTGNKLNPSDFLVADISKTSVCPLARVMRQELKKRGIKNLKVVHSKETPKKPKQVLMNEQNKQIPSSVSFVPPIAGLIMASEVIKDILEI